ncbi:MAG: addiction module component [Verrucomicrobiales bacterium VVV1]|nr:MAG: addiction module component [Verrucomicrobiales bacterium VVV1]
MTVAAEKIKAELAKLSDSERGELAHFLIQSLDQSEDEGAETAWDNELERRADEIISGRSVAVPADKMFSELRAKYL